MTSLSSLPHIYFDLKTGPEFYRQGSLDLDMAQDKKANLKRKRENRYKNATPAVLSVCYLSVPKKGRVVPERGVV